MVFEEWAETFGSICVLTESFLFSKIAWIIL